MKVFKFGGASINSIDRIKNLASILHSYKTENLVIIISAMGKTTNALEKVAENYFAQNTTEAFTLFENVKQQHVTTGKKLFSLRRKTTGIFYRSRMAYAR
jgi:aspartate kinase